MQRGEVHGAADEDAEDEDYRDVGVLPALVRPHADGVHGDEGAHQKHLRETKRKNVRKAETKQEDGGAERRQRKRQRGEKSRSKEKQRNGNNKKFEGNKGYGRGKEI